MLGAQVIESLKSFYKICSLHWVFSISFMLFTYVSFFSEHFLLIWTYMPIETIRKSKRKKGKKETKKPIKMCIECVK